MIVVILLLLEILGCNDIEVQNEISLWSSSTQLKMFVDEVQDVPKLYGYKVVHGRLVPNSLTIGMFQITWVSSSFFYNFFFHYISITLCI